MKVIILIFLLSNLIWGDGIVRGSDLYFQQLSKVEQDKIIKKDFKILHNLFKNLNSIIQNIDNTRKEIEKLKKNMEKRNDTCFALSIMDSDLKSLNTKLSIIKNKNTKEYKKIQNKYIEQRDIYNIAKSKILCKEI